MKKWLFAIIILIVTLSSHMTALKVKPTSSRGSWFKGSSRNTPKTKPMSTNYGHYAGTPKMKPKSGGLKGMMTGSTAKKVVAGLAAAYIGSKVAKGIGRMLMYNGHPYYFGSDYYPGLSSSSKIRCEYTLSGDEVSQFSGGGGANVTQIIYECDARTQRCCGIECCSTMMGAGSGGYSGGSNSWWGIVFGLIFTLLFVGCIAFLVYKSSRRFLDCICPTNHSQEETYAPVGVNPNVPPAAPYGSAPYGQPPPPGYPASDGMPSSAGYPPQAATYSAYPPYPNQPPPPYGFKP
ncbi:hypothetical protein T08_13309 [Trichinella sp. T8]|nr:hypothetical protein T08_13309 [Trichinella sp. T8]